MPDKLLIDKNPVISFRVVEDGIRPLDEADGNLVIDTSESHQVEVELTVMSYDFISVPLLCFGLICLSCLCVHAVAFERNDF